MKKIIVGFAAVAVIFTLAPVVRAQTNAELMAQVQALLAQVAQLQKELAALRGGEDGVVARWCHDFNKNLSFGASGSEVKALQTALEQEGFQVSDSESSGGTFGEHTASAVVGFQDKYRSEILSPVGLVRGSGYVGSSTRAKLNKLYGCGTIGDPPLPRPANVQVLYPNGGESFMRYQTMTFTWINSSFDFVDLSLVPVSGAYQGSFSRYGIATSVSRQPADKQVYVWGKEDILNSGIPEGSYYFEVCRASTVVYNSPETTTGGSVDSGTGSSGTTSTYLPYQTCDRSDRPFAITGSKDTPVQITYPSAGATLVQGKTYTIIWVGSDSGVNSYAVYLVGGNLGSNSSRYLGVAYASQRSFTWTVPSDIDPGSDYQIQLSGPKATGGNSGSFRIIKVISDPGIASDSDNSPDYTGMSVYPITRERYPDLFVKGVTKGQYTGASAGSSWIFSDGESPPPPQARRSYDPYSTYYDNCGTSRQLNEGYVLAGTNKIGAVGIQAPDGYVCKNGAFIAETEGQGSPQVLYPNGGETFTKGTPVTLTWSYPSALDSDVKPGVNLWLARVETGARYIVAEGVRWQSSDKQVYVWNSVGKGQGGIDIPEGTYYFRVCSADRDLCDQSDRPFTIASNSSGQNLEKLFANAQSIMSRMKNLTFHDDSYSEGEFVSDANAFAKVATYLYSAIASSGGFSSDVLQLGNQLSQLGELLVKNVATDHAIDLVRQCEGVLNLLYQKIYTGVPSSEGSS